MKKKTAGRVRVVQLVVILPHTNAQEERVFSTISKNKTKFRPYLQLDGILSSIISVKLANLEPCNEYEPPKIVLEKARRATMGNTGVKAEQLQTILFYISCYSYYVILFEQSTNFFEIRFVVVSYQHVTLIFVHSHIFFNVLSLMLTRCSWNLRITASITLKFSKTLNSNLLCCRQDVLRNP